MTNDHKDKDLEEYEKKILVDQKQENELKNPGQHPDEQNRLKDKENRR
ncbi:hypothetical protein [Heyndrickxia acidicola]|uniref:DUF4023 domain-containing protein n=1 Tax=Heyndrickxia acidicola TaxID=209389 RepID=A0ABU6MIW5_9BACI|nr:hypothetical protein [Heyndrickxia acidicola]MED1203010.1 hypothetical protein [Heyndrickxia acidicola]